MRVLCVSIITLALLAGSAIGVAAQDTAPMTTTEELLAGFVTEEVEPGVYRVINDGVQDLTREPSDADAFLGVDGNIVAGLDKSVWLFLPDRFFRLGDEDQTAPGWGLYRHDADIEVDPGGHVWMIAEQTDGSADLVAFRDRLDEDRLGWGDPAWPEYAQNDYLGVEVLADGSVVSAWYDLSTGDGPEGHLVHVGTFWGGWLPRADPLRVYLTDEGIDEVRWDFAVSSADIWLAQEGGPLHRDGEVQQPPFDPWSLDVGPDGTLWIGATDPADGRVCGLRLARFDGADWDVWGRDDGIPDVGSVFWYGGCQEGIHTVAPDGSVWLAPLDFLAGRECSGVANFDGTTWTRHLPGLCVYDAAIAPDGTVWLQAGEVNSDVDGEPWYDFDPVGTYVITPEAAAGGE